MSATYKGLVNLTCSLRWYIDGNLTSAPKHFTQLYVIRVEINRNLTTAVYIFLQKKTVTTYKQMLSILMKNVKNNIYFLILC